MSDADTPEQNPDQAQQQLQSMNEEQQVMEIASLMSVQIADFGSDSKNVLETSVCKINEKLALDTGEVNNLSTSFESHNLEDHDNNKSMEIEDQIIVLQEKADSGIVDPKAENVRKYILII